MTINSQRDVCGVQKAGGIAISAAQLLRCMRIAATQAVKLTDRLREVVRTHETARLASRVRRHRHGDAAQMLPSTFVLGAKLPGEQPAAAPATGDADGPADAMEASAPAYLAADSDGDDESDGAEAGAADWDMVEPARGSFPFSGPLRPVAAGDQEAAAELEPAKAAGVAPKQRNAVRFCRAAAALALAAPLCRPLTMRMCTFIPRRPPLLRRTRKRPRLCLRR